MIVNPFMPGNLLNIVWTLNTFENKFEIYKKNNREILEGELFVSFWLTFLLEIVFVKKP